MTLYIELYTIKSTCYYEENSKYCPVLVGIVGQLQKQYDGAKFLLQVWDKENNKVYEKLLRRMISRTNFSRRNNYLGHLWLVLPI